MKAESRQIPLKLAARLKFVYYHLSNLQNHIAAQLTCLMWLEESHQNNQFLSPIQSWSDDFQKNEVRSSRDSAKIVFSPDPVRSSPVPCSSLLSVVITHLWCSDPTFGEFIPRLGISATFWEKFGELRYLGIF